MEFKLNKKEQDNLTEALAAIAILYPFAKLEKKYIFTPTSIGCSVDVRIIGTHNSKELFDITKDITDYHSW